MPIRSYCIIPILFYFTYLLYSYVILFRKFFNYNLNCVTVSPTFKIEINNNVVDITILRQSYILQNF